MAAERIDPLFFGSAERRLFGCHHGPLEAASAKLGLVIAAPPGHEYSRSHRALRQLAGLVAANGMRALRFDLGGTGDSPGDEWPSSLAAWVADVGLAQRELSLRTRTSRTALLGVRLSATLALERAASAPSCASLVLLAPILDGEAYSAALSQIEQRFEQSLPGRRPAGSPSRAGVECLGFLWPTALLDSLRQWRPPQFERPPAARVLILESTLSERARTLGAELERVGSRVQHTLSSGLEPWNEDVDRGLVPTLDLQRIVDFLGQDS